MKTHQLIEALNWRYATKKFDPDQKIDEQTLDALLEATRLSASSMGLQPYKFIHVKDVEVRKSLREHSFDQSQITDASDLIVFSAMKEISDDHIEEFARTEANLRNRSEEQIERKIKSTKAYISRMNPDELLQWNSRQAYIAMGTLLSAAALMKVDACPMEGIIPKEYDRILQLEHVNLQCLAVVTLGFRSADDSFSSQTKFRFPKGQIIKTI